jgi:hypothetical protein
MKCKNFFVESSKCVLCDDNAEESMSHLFFECDYSRNFWWKLDIEWNTDNQIIDMLIDASSRSNNNFFKKSMMLGCWSLWNQRNKIIFENEQRDLETCFSFFKHYIALIRHMVKTRLKEGMQDWLDLL